MILFPEGASGSRGRGEAPSLPAPVAVARSRARGVGGEARGEDKEDTAREEAARASWSSWHRWRAWGQGRVSPSYWAWPDRCD